MISQAEVARAVRGAIKGHRAAGLRVGEVRTELRDGAVTVIVTSAPESGQPVVHGEHIDDKIIRRIEAIHARRP